MKELLKDRSFQLSIILTIIFLGTGDLQTYRGGQNELEDGYIIFKENNYFKYYEEVWLIISVKQREFIGRYSKFNDTVYWIGSVLTQRKYITIYRTNA